VDEQLELALRRFVAELESGQFESLPSLRDVARFGSS
jgi:hypothetical protein